MITIGFLADHLDTIPTLAHWFREQWPDYYAGMSQEELERNFLEDASHDRLSIRLLALESDELAGTIVLREQGSETLPGFQPELGGLYVVAPQRGQGIATELVRAGMQVALEQGYQTVFATTVVAAGILERLGWRFLKTVTYQDGELGLYQWAQ